MKATIITLAVAVAVAAPQALAKTIYPSEDTPTTGWDSPGGWMGDDGFGGFGDGAIGMASEALPGMTVICTRSMLSTVCPIGLTGIDVVDMPAAPQLNLSDAGSGDSQTPEQKANCVADCMTADAIATNNCKIASDELRVSLISKTQQTGLLGFVFKAFRGSKFKGGLDPDQVNLAYGLSKDEIERKLADQISTCAANVAKSTNNCLQGKCHAWFLAPLALLPRRRRREEEETAAA